eukprot:CAMPEP_0185835278 /NCGR_PEP_ID=MMETSP1353-20130828/7408_1 /TAXON_ID=1077150 /ORGANISM="Erythrolobus australicus, Strain CCMP3124" /LENGTH=317 /DNA_ID=CAMNT_0028533875 /DNA_START=517 /DNA_END=1467 /DNA_ORIENTATION=+
MWWVSKFLAFSSLTVSLLLIQGVLALPYDQKTSFDGDAEVLRASHAVEIRVSINTDFDFRWSLSSSRTDSAGLQGAELLQLNVVFVFLETQRASEIQSVDFWLDVDVGAGPSIQRELNPPYDLLGGSVNSANGLDLSQLLVGPHFVVAQVTFKNSTMPTVQTRAEFDVTDLSATATPVSTPSPIPSFTKVPLLAEFQWSLSSIRSNPMTLQGSNLMSDTTVYIFLQAELESSIQLVEFWLDAAVGTMPPLQRERNPPYDLLGGSVQTAKGLAVSELSVGSHFVIARVNLRDPSIQPATIRADFVVGDEMATASPTPT